MPRLDLPGYLDEKLSWTSALGRDVSALMDAVSAIATHNETPFFPAYTDHGIDHLAAVLRWCVELAPVEAIPVLGEEDAAVIVGGALLHDLAMHLHPEGFAELVSGTGPWRPMEWFREPQGSRDPDLPWPELWDEFKAEARHHDHTEIVRIVGPEHRGAPKVVFDDTVQTDALDRSDRLYVGEFLRRHHARLAHEIAVFGFPGLGDRWPSPPERPRAVADVRNLMGLVARSHNEGLRMVVDHLDEHEDGDRAPAGVHVPFVAALLRIADYAQLGSDRAPSVLLRMVAPQSPVSIQAWKDHEAVTKVEPHDSRDSFALRFRVSPAIELSTYLQVDALLTGLQEELDQCAAVLAEVYGKDPALSGLAKQRVRSNIDSPAFRDALPFVPRESRLRSAEDMFRLVIHDLYGDHPWVAGRELAQNALDAVRERWRVEASGAVRPADEGWPDPEDRSVDVLVEVSVGDDDQLTLRIADRGIGMIADTVVDYFLKAGASLGPTARELAAVPSEDAAKYVKAGRFGIGVLAAFLLGDEVHVRTRHLTEDTGLSFTARLDSDLVEIARGVDMPVGTEVTVVASQGAAEALVENMVAEVGRFLRLDWSDLREKTAAIGGSVLAASVRQACSGARPSVLVCMSSQSVRLHMPSIFGELGSDPEELDWQLLDIDGPAAVEWAVDRPDGRLVHNGVLVMDPSVQQDDESTPAYRWSDSRLRESLVRPLVSVVDSRHMVELSLNRYRLLSPTLPFEADLIRSLAGDLVAEALVRPRSWSTVLIEQEGWTQPAVSTAGTFPMLPGLPAQLGFGHVNVVLALKHGTNGPSTVKIEPAILSRVATHPIWARHPTNRVRFKRASDMTHEDHLAHEINELFTLSVRETRYSGVHQLNFRYGSSDSQMVSALRAAFGEQAEVEDPLTDSIGRLVLQDSDASTYLIVALKSHPEPGAGTAGLLGDVWMEVVGRTIPLDDEERLELAAKVELDHPKMRPHLQRQRRMAAAEVARSGP